MKNMTVKKRTLIPDRNIRGYENKRVGVLMGGLSEERAISLKTGKAVLSALLQKGYDAVAIDAGRDVARRIMRRGVQTAFIALHGRFGEDGCIQGALEIMGIPYTGSGVMASALAMDKIFSKKMFLFHGVSTPVFADIANARQMPALKLPVIVKPASQGSAIGVSIVRKKAQIRAAVEKAAAFNGGVLVEEFIKGRELTVSILSGTCLPVIEICPKDGFYDYNAKYTKGLTEFIVPARLKKGVEKAVLKEALGAYNALGCAGAARVDVMLSEDDRPYVLEVNTVPGLTELSLFPKAAAAAGMDYPTLIVKMLEGAAIGKH